MNACLAFHRQVVVLALAGFAFILGLERAGAEVFTVDTNQSSLTIAGFVDEGVTFTNQGPGSLTAVYSGMIQATESGGTIHFTGGSAIAAITNGSWQPLPGGSAGSAPADYGLAASFDGSPFVGALRSVVLDVTSPTNTVSGGQFTATNLVFAFPTNSPATLDYSETIFMANEHGSTNFSAISQENNVSSNATLTTAEGQETLTIPMNAVFLITASYDVTLLMTGQIVAVRSVSSAPPLTIQSVSVSNDVVTLEWQSTAGQDFDVLSSTNVINWKTNAMNVTSGTSSYSYSETNNAVMEYYRLAQ